MKVLRWILVTASAAVASVVAVAQETTDQQQAAVAGAERIALYRDTLALALQASAVVDRESAMAAFHIQAPAIARNVGKLSAQVGWTRLEPINPDNAPQAWMVPLLTQYAEGNTTEPSVVHLGGNRYGYVEPILTDDTCQSCHLTGHDGVEIYNEAGKFAGLYWSVIEKIVAPER